MVRYELGYLTSTISPIHLFDVNFKGRKCPGKAEGLNFVREKAKLSPE